MIDENRSVVYDLRRFLKVKQGEKGLRQSDALFQHVKNLPEMFEEINSYCNAVPAAISFSSKPRPTEGSYMPVFLAGESFARTIASVLDVPVYGFSHQEGHIEAVKEYSQMPAANRFMACHFSGGTTELLEVSDNGPGYRISIIGGSKDISFGQVVDRAGVLMGMNFPSGEEMDKIACAATYSADLLTPVKVKDGWLNLSGIDTQMKKAIENDAASDSLIKELFEKIAQAMSDMILQGAEITGIDQIVMAGGVSSSTFIQNILQKKLIKTGIKVYFDEKGLSQDNAVGTALLGGRALWH